MSWKGKFHRAARKGFLNTNVDPLYQGVRNKSKLTKSVASEIEQKNEGGDGCEIMAPLTNEARGLEISQERYIGVVSSKSY